jgi:hypothetical protein
VAGVCTSVLSLSLGFPPTTTFAGGRARGNRQPGGTATAAGVVEDAGSSFPTATGLFVVKLGW